MTVVPKVVLEIKKRMPFEYIPALHDVYDSFKASCLLVLFLFYLFILILVDGY